MRVNPPIFKFLAASFCGRHYGQSAEAAYASWLNQVECWLAIRGACYDDREREDPGMGAARKYVVIDPATGKLDRRIFSEQAIYDDEMERIFGRAWLMIGHESLVPAVDDFFHTYMGEDPVILTRDGQGRLHALLNMCRHRGNRVVRCDDGNAKRFMCTYHGWTYRNDGALEHVPGESEAYYDALDRPSLGLIEARVETYAGIVFATWAKDAPSLEAYLGDARWYLDTVFNRRDGGMQALGPMKWLEPVNWKTLVDNCSDNYHVPTSHLSSARVQTRYLGRPRLSHEDQFESPNKHAFVNGHWVTFRDADDNAPRYVHGMSSETMRLFQEYHDATMPEVERRLGTLRARRVQLGNHSIFPNGILGLRLALPRGPLKTEFWHFVLLDRDTPEEIEARDPYRQPSQQRCRWHVRAGRRRQLASGDRSEHEPPRAPAPPGSVDGHGACGAASGLSGARLRALHLGEQPAPLL